MARGRDEAWYLALFIWQTLEVLRAFDLYREPVEACGLYGLSWTDWHNDRLAVVSGPICTEQVFLKRATGVLCVCVCGRVCVHEKSMRESAGEDNKHQISTISPLLTAGLSWHAAILFLFGCTVRARMPVRTRLCHVTPGQVSAMQWLPWLSSAASVQHP